jgi:UDP-2,4-diacetamido-2,4,6-trideoxy-beta-L-altropyranose hydrolase
MVVDDLASRRHVCDLLLDQNYYTAFRTRYDGLVPPDCRLCLGPEYVLLRPEFAAAKSQLRERDGTVRRILVTFGANDPGGETFKALAALRSLELTEVAVDVVAGAGNPRRDELRQTCDALPGCSYHEGIDYMARLIGDADLALGAGGATTWERCVLGLPSLTVVIAPNQLETTVDTAHAGAIRFLGRSDDVTAADIRSAVAAAIADPAGNRELSARAMALVPTVDGAARLADTLSRYPA